MLLRILHVCKHRDPWDGNMEIRKFKQINQRRWMEIPNVKAVGVSTLENGKLCINIAVDDETPEILALITAIPYPVRIINYKKDDK